MRAGFCRGSREYAFKRRVEAADGGACAEPYTQKKRVECMGELILVRRNYCCNMWKRLVICKSFYFPLLVAEIHTADVVQQLRPQLFLASCRSSTIPSRKGSHMTSHSSSSSAKHQRPRQGRDNPRLQHVYCGQRRFSRWTTTTLPLPDRTKRRWGATHLDLFIGLSGRTEKMGKIS